MKNRNIVLYVALLAIGIFLGWMAFGSDSKKDTTHSHEADSETNQMWTCSMHPQIMQPEPGDCPICGMDLIPAESSADGLLADEFKLTENAMALANVQTSIIGISEADGNTIKLSGKVVENEEANTVQASYFSGRIERLNVSVTGEDIRTGQLLATIYSPELYAAQQELLTAASIKESQPALYKAVRNKLKLWKLSENQINQIEETGKVKQNFPVYATVSGTVTEKMVAQGDYVKQGQPLLKIANLNTVWGHFDVYENQIDLFKKGQEVTVTTKAYSNKEFKGKVDFINPTLNTNTRTVTLRVVLNNKDGIFKPGMFLEGQIDGGMSSGQTQELIIPSSAVLWTGKRSVVYVKTNPNEPIFEMKEVLLGNRIGDSYKIVEGLSKGMEIVTNGTFTVDAAAQLQSKKSMMNASKVSNASKEDHSMHTLEKAERLKVSDEFQKKLKLVYNAYIQLKDALVEDDVEVASGFSEALFKKVKQLPLNELKSVEAKKTGERLKMELEESARKASKAKTIEEQRDVFQMLSLQLLGAIEVFGINEEVFNLHCPMANNDRGAYWLSTNKEVLNPYFGAAMLKCGEVKDSIE